MKLNIANTVSILNNLTKDSIIRVVMYLQPEIFTNSKLVSASVHFDVKKKKYYTDINPARTINGPLSEYGQLLEPPIREEYDAFIEDCVYLIETSGFKILKRMTSLTSQKSEYIIVYGMDSKPCGSLIFELRISDHPFDATFPEELKDEVVELLKMENVLNESATKAGINFTIEKVTVGLVLNDTWGRAFDRLGHKLDQMRRKVMKELNKKSNT